MADTPQAGETVTPEPLSNDVAPPAAPQANAVDPAEVERLKKEAEQARMRAQQLENQLKTKEQEEEAARQKQLEDKEEYKALYETAQQKLDRLEAEREENTRQAQLTAATDNLFKEYPAAVVELAKTAGLSLTDDSETAQATLKEKLDAFKAKVAPNAPTVASGNPSAAAVTPPSENPGRLGKPRTLGPSDEVGAITAGDGSKVGEYISGLSAIKQMKRDAGLS